MRLVALSIMLALAAGAPSPAEAARNRSDKDFPGRTTARPAPPDTGGVCTTPPPVVPPGGITNDVGNTCTGLAHITNYGGTCAASLPFPYPGPELIYQLNLLAGNGPAFSADLTGSTGDLALFLVGSACGNGTNCVANSQDAIGPGAGPEVIAAASYASGTYFLYVDSYYGLPNPAACGSYSLTITPPLPAELIDFQIY